jgi:hypothetical protein
MCEKREMNFSAFHSPPFTPMLAYTMSSSEKLKLPKIRFLTPEENDRRDQPGLGKGA